MKLSVTKQWFTAAELAELKLPALPHTKRKINERAQSENWAFRTDEQGLPMARARLGRGGGIEYHMNLLPHSARTDMIRRGVALGGTETHGGDLAPTASPIWQWYEIQSSKVQAEATRRLLLIQKIELLCEAGMTRSNAVTATAQEGDASASTLWGWLKLIAGLSPQDYLPALAPRRRGGGAEAAIDHAVWEYFKSDYLRPEQPTLSSCYMRAVQVADARGVSLPCERTLQRKLEREVDPRVIISRREGADALRRSMPAQRRTVSHLHAMAMVNIDGHKFDVFARLPDGRVIRPIMVAIQDIFSRKILSWRIGETESAVQTRLAFADLFRDFGIPKECVLDNGRAFASKWITGGATSRFRFKIREDEPTGLLTSLGIKIHWALPFRGQSKPIERAFRDLCDTVAKHPAFAGAYTGNKPDAKPENYGSAAVPMDVFTRIVEQGIAVHNARGNRRTEMARGRSFDTVFAESYATAPIGKAAPEQMRLALLAADQVKVDRRTGQISLFGNRYWCEAMSALHGRSVTVRFDPDDLHQAIHVYDQAGQYLTSADLIADTGFNDAAGAKLRAKQEADYRKAVKTAERMEQLLSADELAAMLPSYEDETALPEPTIIRPVRHRGQTSAALKKIEEVQTTPAFVDRFAGAVTRLRIVD